MVGAPEESQILAPRPSPPGSLGLEQPSSQVPGKQRWQRLPHGVSDFPKSGLLQAAVSAHASVG